MNVFKIQNTGKVYYSDVSGLALSGGSTSGEYTPVITTSDGSIDAIRIANYIVNGSFVTINGNFEMTYATAGTTFTILVGTPVNYPPAESVTDNPSGSALVLGGQGNASAPPCQSIGWVSNAASSNIQILMETALSMQPGQDLNLVSFSITYRHQ
jgi:hypothetical protein